MAGPACSSTASTRRPSVDCCEPPGCWWRRRSLRRLRKSRPANVAEFDLIELIRARAMHSRGDVVLGIGDDAALLEVPAGQRLVACTDTLVAGVHFPEATAPQDIGWKSLAVNLSDLAAMGAQPAWAMLALALPLADVRFVEQFAEGFMELARQFEVALVGGDTTRGPLGITVTAMGFVPEGGALLRSGARAGDAVFVTGTLGDAAGALEMRESGIGNRGPETRAAAALPARLNRPEPRVAAGLALRGIAGACIDVSDGLLEDLGHLCCASGVGAEIDADALPLSPVLQEAFPAAQRRGFALAGGDDYELCFTASEADSARVARAFAALDCGATRIGRVVAQPGVRVFDANGKTLEPRRRGWQHFAT
ncbi:MAG: thiamine-phosphate kinase [Proteobacteria bacterium]|nr:thiamine-phosphate kinase [Pseudomonadota bacterium]